MRLKKVKQSQKIIKKKKLKLLKYPHTQVIGLRKIQLIKWFQTKR